MTSLLFALTIAPQASAQPMSSANGTMLTWPEPMAELLGSKRPADGCARIAGRRTRRMLRRSKMMNEELALWKNVGLCIPTGDAGDKPLTVEWSVSAGGAWHVVAREVSVPSAQGFLFFPLPGQLILAENERGGAPGRPPPLPLRGTARVTIRPNDSDDQVQDVVFRFYAQRDSTIGPSLTVQTGPFPLVRHAEVGDLIKFSIADFVSDVPPSVRVLRSSNDQVDKDDTVLADMPNYSGHELQVPTSECEDGDFVLVVVTPPAGDPVSTSAVYAVKVYRHMQYVRASASAGLGADYQFPRDGSAGVFRASVPVFFGVVASVRRPYWYNDIGPRGLGLTVTPSLLDIGAAIDDAGSIHGSVGLGVLFLNQRLLVNVAYRLPGDGVTLGLSYSLVGVRKDE